MSTKEIIAITAMYNTILECLLECKRVNTASNYENDYLFVECDESGYYTNELGDIMPNCLNGKGMYYTCDNIAETAAKFTELCMKAGAKPGDIYTSY